MTILISRYFETNKWLKYGLYTGIEKFRIYRKINMPVPILHFYFEEKIGRKHVIYTATNKPSKEEIDERYIYAYIYSCPKKYERQIVFLQRLEKEYKGIVE